MEEVIKQRLIDAWQSLPEDIRGEPASEHELRRFEEKHGPIPSDFKWFLTACGSCPVGQEWVDGIETLFDSHVKFTEESKAENGWTMKNVFIIGWDGGGNPFGICSKTGKVLVEDHDFGGIHEMAPSIKDFLIQGLIDDD